MTPAEERFLTMFRMALDDGWSDAWNRSREAKGIEFSSFVAEAASFHIEQGLPFSVIDKAFSDLCKERPELSEFYARAKAAAEGSR